MPIILLLCLVPTILGTVIEYVICRLTRRALLRWVPPLVVLAVGAAVAAVRYFGWSAEHGGERAPLDTLLLVPGVPVLLLLTGLALGRALWRRLWLPKVVKDR